MPGPLGCKLFRSSKVTNNTLRAKVRNHKHSTEEPGAPRPLLENVEEFTTSAGVARFTFVYDFIDSVPYRNETQKIVRTAVAQVTVLDPPATSLYFVYARSTV